ncbi:MAG: type II secretion system secretin GspD [Nitrospirae bacterium]|nr:type II secretion system secretin GspD [Nitrospirota bacterium]
MHRKRGVFILHSSFFIILFILFSLFILHPSSFAETKTQQQSKDKKVTVNFVDVEIPVVVKFISDITGKNFVFDDNVKGSVTIIAPSKLSVDDAYNLFTSVLEIKGFTVVPSGKVYKIVPLQQAKQSGTEIVKEDVMPGSDAYITRLIQLQSISSSKAVSFLQPIISQNGHISSFGPGNMIMIVDSVSNIEKILKILDSIDRPGVEEPELILLKYANAEDVVKIITEAFSISSKIQPQSLRTPRPGETASTVSVDEMKNYVFADTRLNAVVLVADKQEKQSMKKMIALLDIPLPEATSKINVYFLEHADATELSKVLEGMLVGISQQVKSIQTGAQTVKTPFESGSKIILSPDKATNSIVIVASPGDYQNLVQVIKQLDRKRKQVYVEAMIVEASIEKLQELGAKWRIIAEKDGEPVAVAGFGTIDATSMQDILFGLTGLTAGGMGNFLEVPLTTINEDGTVSTTTFTIPGFAALFSLNEFKGAVNVLSTPQILTSDNKEAEIVVGENIPFISERERDITTTANIVLSSIERKDVGITLRITPQITEGDYVKMDIYQEISAVKPESETILINIGPTTTKRSTKTTVVVKDNQTVVIGGLMEEREEESLNKIPILGDIPLLGWLFKNKTVEKSKTNLLVFLTPHIVRESEQLSNLTEQKNMEFARAENKYKPGELLVKFKEDVAEHRIQEILTLEKASVITISKLKGLYLIRLKKGQDVRDAIEKFMHYDEVEYSEPNYIRKIQSGK